MSKTFQDEIHEAFEYINNNKQQLSEAVDDKESLTIIIGLVAIFSAIKNQGFIMKQDLAKRDVVYVEFADRKSSKFVSDTLVSMINAAKSSVVASVKENPLIQFLKNLKVVEQKKWFGLGKSTLQISF